MPACLRVVSSQMQALSELEDGGPGGLSRAGGPAFKVLHRLVQVWISDASTHLNRWGHALLGGVTGHGGSHTLLHHPDLGSSISACGTSIIRI